MAAVKLPVWEEGIWSDERCEYKYSGKKGERMLHKECVKYKRQFCEEFAMVCPGAGIFARSSTVAIELKCSRMRLTLFLCVLRVLPFPLRIEGCAPL